MFRPPMCSSGQSSWQHIQRSGFDSRRYQIFWEIVGLDRGPLNLASTIEELFLRKSIGLRLESREYGRKDPSGWLRGTIYPKKLALTSPTSSSLSVGIVRSRTQATVRLYVSIPYLVYKNIIKQNPWLSPRANYTVRATATCQRR
jgi:hypothetical protein